MAFIELLAAALGFSPLEKVKSEIEKGKEYFRKTKNIPDYSRKDIADFISATENYLLKFRFSGRNSKEIYEIREEFQDMRMEMLR